MASHSSKKRIASLILASRNMNLKFSSAFMMPREGKLMSNTWYQIIERGTEKNKKWDISEEEGEKVHRGLRRDWSLSGPACLSGYQLISW